MGEKPEVLFHAVLTDVSRGIYVENWEISGYELGVEGEWSVTKRRMRGGLSDGVDLVTVDNGSLQFTVVPTRGMSIWRGSYRGIRIGWDSPIVNPVHPRHINLEAKGGLGWLDGFNEWVVRCGLESFGAPGIDVIIDNMGRKKEVMLPLHGRIANIPAEEVKVNILEDPELKIVIEGVLYERTMFGSNIKLTTEISTTLDSNKITINDTVQNLKPLPQEVQLLYHCNYGRPILGEGTKIEAPFLKVVPRDDRAAEGIGRFNIYGPPQAGFVEQVYFCELASDEEGKTIVAIIDKDDSIASSISYSVKRLPYFTIWKNTASIEEGYVTGLEPATSYPNPRWFERKKGRVFTLPPKGKFKAELEIAVHVGRPEVSRLKDEIKRIKAETTIFREPHPEYSPLEENRE